MCMQWVYIMPIKSVPMVPTTSPAFLNASGMDRILVAVFHFIK